MGGSGGCHWTAETHLHHGIAWCTEKAFHATAMNPDPHGHGQTQYLPGQERLP